MSVAYMTIVSCFGVSSTKFTFEGAGQGQSSYMRLSSPGPVPSTTSHPIQTASAFRSSKSTTALNSLTSRAPKLPSNFTPTSQRATAISRFMA